MTSTLAPIENPTAELERQLTELSDAYTYQLNALLESGREDLADDISDAFVQDRDDLVSRHTR